MTEKHFKPLISSFFPQMCPQCVLMVNTQKCRSSDLTSKYRVTSCHRSFSIHLPLRISFGTNHLHWYRAQVSLEKLHLAELAEPRPESDLENLQGDSVDPCACADSVYTSRVWVLWDESFSKQREACNYLLFSWMGSKSEREHHPILLYHAAAGVGVIRRGPLLLPTRFYRPEKLHSILILQFLFSTPKKVFWSFDLYTSGIQMSSSSHNKYMYFLKRQCNYLCDLSEVIN